MPDWDEVERKPQWTVFCVSLAGLKGEGYLQPISQDLGSTSSWPNSVSNQSCLLNRKREFFENNNRRRGKSLYLYRDMGAILCWSHKKRKCTAQNTLLSNGKLNVSWLILQRSSGALYIIPLRPLCAHQRLLITYSAKLHVDTVF